MVQEIKLPEIAENVSEGTITSVLVSEGDTIEADQDILEMETDKASVEVPAPLGGTVQEILVGEGDEVSVGQVVMKVEAEEGAGGEEAADETPDAGEPAGKDSGEPEAGGAPRTGATRAATAGETADAAEAADRARAADVPASPATRRLARELGVDITQVDGSGPAGRISQEDVKAYARRTVSGAFGPGDDSAGRGAAVRERDTAAGERRETMTRVRALTAERTAQSWQTVPHVTQHEEADLSRLEAWMKEAAPRVEKAGGKLTVTAVLVKLLAHALRVYPRFNASADLDAGEIIYHDGIALGIAADTDRGLLVPVLRDPDRKGVVSIAVELGELAAQARNGELEPSQMQGATFSLSNLGGIGGTAFTPIIVPPAVAILGVARAQTRPVYTGSSFEPHQVLPLSLSYDHRVIDGADGARFVVWLKRAIEDPFAALMEGGS